MGALVDHQSDGYSEPECSSPTPLDEAPGKPHVLPGTNTTCIIRETRAEIEQARGKADELIKHFAKTYVETAGKLREEAIQRYRRRLEGLPAEVRVEVCDTLATDAKFCGLMDFGYGNLMSGGMHFIYKVESDAAFNALSHHAWKDFHQSFLDKDSSPPCGNVCEQSRPPGAHLMHSDDDEDELAPHHVRLPVSSEESDLSSVEEVSLSYGDPTEASQTKSRERGQSSFSPSQDWATDDQSVSSDAPRRRAGPPSKDQSEIDALENRRPTRPPNKPWSAEEESLIQGMMATQLRKQGNLEISRQTASNLLKFFPRRTSSAIRNKWKALAIKDTQYNRLGRKGKMRAYNAKGKVQDEGTKCKKRYEGYADSTMEDEDGDRDDSNEPEVKRGSPDLPSGLRRQSQPTSSAWSLKEHESIMRSTEGKARDEIDFKEVASALPGPSRRTADACRSYWSRRIHSPFLNKGQPIRRCADPTRAPKSDQGSPGDVDTIITVARVSKHARESDDESDERSTLRRRTHDSLPPRSSPSRSGHEDGSEAGNSDV